MFIPKHILSALLFFFIPLFCLAEKMPSPAFLQTWIDSIPFQGSILDSSFWKQNSNDFLVSNSRIQWKLVSGQGKDRVIAPKKSQTLPIWKQNPLDVQIRFVGTGPVKDIQVNFWNRGDAGKHASMQNETRSFALIESFLSDCRAEGLVPVEKKQNFSSKVKLRSTEVTLPNCLVEIQAEPHEYLIVIFRPCAQSAPLNAVQQKIQDSRRIDPYKEKEALRESLTHNVVTRPNGDLVVDGIPMVDQGDKGYCVPATCARILQYYGFDTNEHALAELMGTTASGGTSIQSLQVNLKKLTSGLPVYLKEFSFSFSRVERYVSRGYPLIWLVPSHCRLIIGVNPKTREILYSDSWGVRGIENRMSSKKAEANTLFLALLK